MVALCGILDLEQGAFFSLKAYKGDDEMTVQLGSSGRKIKDAAKQKMAMRFDKASPWNATATGFHFSDGDAGLEFVVKLKNLEAFIKEFTGARAPHQLLRGKRRRFVERRPLGHRPVTVAFGECARSGCSDPRWQADNIFTVPGDIWRMSDWGTRCLRFHLRCAVSLSRASSHCCWPMRSACLRRRLAPTPTSRRFSRSTAMLKKANYKFTVDGDVCLLFFEEKGIGKFPLVIAVDDNLMLISTQVARAEKITRSPELAAGLLQANLDLFPAEDRVRPEGESGLPLRHPREDGRCRRPQGTDQRRSSRIPPTCTTMRPSSRNDRSQPDRRNLNSGRVVMSSFAHVFRFSWFVGAVALLLAGSIDLAPVPARADSKKTVASIAEMLTAGKFKSKQDGVNFIRSSRAKASVNYRSSSPPSTT